MDIYINQLAAYALWFLSDEELWLFLLPFCVVRVFLPPGVKTEVSQYFQTV